MVHLVVNSNQETAARKHIYRQFQEVMVEPRSNLVNSEIVILKSVSRKAHCPEYLGSIVSSDYIQYMYDKPWWIGSLEEALKSPDTIFKGADRWRLGAQWMLCLTSTLYFLHSSTPAVNNRHLKPQSKLVMADFGVGELLCNSSALKSYTGTEVYMAPEYFGKSAYRQTAVVFSLGCVFSEPRADFNGFGRLPR
jgi:serine/threonine protein kinase